MNKKIMASILSFIKQANKNLNSIKLIISVDEKGEIQGECMVNNEVSEEILIELKKIKWDKGESPYLFKQFYLVKK